MDEELDLSNIASHYSDEEAAQAFFEKIRWPNNIGCVHCGSLKVYAITPKEGSAKSRKSLKLWKCGDCKGQFTVTVGTIFEDSHIPLHKWLLAFYLLCSSKKGMSSHQLHRMLKVSYKSAWFMTHRIRYAMGQPSGDQLQGIVEADEVYIGGEEKNKHANKRLKRGRGPVGKTPVLTIVERNGRARSTTIANVTGKNLKAIIRKEVAIDTIIMTDGFPAYHGLNQEFADHLTVDHSAGEYVRGIVSTNTVESYFSILQRGIEGVYHHVSEKHLHRYLAEFDFRYNERKVEDGVRTVKAIQGAEGKRLMLR